VNAIAPGRIETASSTAHEIIAGKNTPRKRPGRSDEVAATIASLTSESAADLSGQLIIRDGGNALQECNGPPPHFLTEVRQPNKRTASAFVQRLSVPRSLAKPLWIGVRAVKLVTSLVEFELACLRRL